MTSSDFILTIQVLLRFFTFVFAWFLFICLHAKQRFQPFHELTWLLWCHVPIIILSTSHHFYFTPLKEKKIQQSTNNQQRNQHKFKRCVYKEVSYCFNNDVEEPKYTLIHCQILLSKKLFELWTRKKWWCYI